MIRVKKLSKSFGKIKAINNISFDLKQGEIIALLGPNGAGKTTLMRLLTGYIFPDSGSIEIFNNNIEENRPVSEKLVYRNSCRIAYPLPESIPIIEKG